VVTTLACFVLFRTRVPEAEVSRSSRLSRKSSRPRYDDTIAVCFVISSQTHYSIWATAELLGFPERYEEDKAILGEKGRDRSTVTFSELGNLGQFGNQLFQIAAVFGYAARHGNQVRLPHWRCAVRERSYDKYFPGILQHRGSCVGTVIQEVGFGYHDLPVLHHADLRGFFQSERYFHHIRDQIRTLYSEPHDIGLELDAYCKLHGLSEFDALHVRFYSRPPNDPGNMGALPASYFSRSVAMLGRNRPVVVATDDKPAFARLARDIGLPQDLHILWFEDPLLDFFMLSRARRIAISNSSFGWWAAYLNGGKEQVIAPDRYFWFNSKVRALRDMSDLYPEHFDELIL
jgi:hypothetical protein